MSGSEWLVMTAGDVAIVYRPGDNRTWRARAHGDGWLILPDMFGSLPPANEAGADPVEVRAARMAADQFGEETSLAWSTYWSIAEFNGWVAYRTGDDLNHEEEAGGWLARQIVEEE